MKIHYFIVLVASLLISNLSVGQNKINLKNDSIEISWVKTGSGYHLEEISVFDGRKYNLENAVGEYTILSASEKPSQEALFDKVDKSAKWAYENFIGSIKTKWERGLSAVALNEAGSATSFYPDSVAKINENEIHFFKNLKDLFVTAKWKLDSNFMNDILVNLTVQVKRDGYYFIVSPTLNITPEKDLNWGMIPGYFQGNFLNENFVSAYGYGQGIPSRPVVVREQTASTLASILTNKDGITLSITPFPGQARDPWEKNKSSQGDWKIGLGLLNRSGQLSPNLQHPVLGEKGSKIRKGEEIKFDFRYTLKRSSWYGVYSHIVNDVYNFKDVLAMKTTKKSLSDRIMAMSNYLKDDSSSLWRIEDFEGLKIGAQEYNSSVMDSEKDAMKNSDYGAMWMLANLSGDTLLKNRRLPFARNFKLAQQDLTENSFLGAASGQYYLYKSKRFVEEWGNYIEPIGLTYYIMLDMGNILLFNPEDTLLRKRLRLGAERLMNWQRNDGSWEVGYDKLTRDPVFNDLKDLRPTFYGLLVAYRILGEEKYLDAAKRGADWFITNAVKQGCFLGVCGDVRFVPDFATGQSAQALLDLYEMTTDDKYRLAAIEVAKIYTASIYTHPIPTHFKKSVGGKEVQDWEISQVGHNFEHGGLLGSANYSGPILLASHAGMFVRFFELTKDSLFLNMARVAALGQDAFVDQNTQVASYYWRQMDKGPGPYPHHAWWQIGWITDYLLSEVELRSNGKITFPRGFITPKVGPHQSYGFSSGRLFDKKVELLLTPDFVEIDNPAIDYFMAKNNLEIYLMLLNNNAHAQKVMIKKVVKKDSMFTSTHNVSVLDKNGEVEFKGLLDGLSFNIPSFGLKVVKVSLK